MTRPHTPHGDLAGRRMLITGATNGIGLEAARTLAGRGAHVVIVGRDPARTDAVARRVNASGTIIADLSELAQVRRAAAEYRERFGALDVLVNNAGAFHSVREVTREGLERTWALNHLSPALLTRELLPTLRQATDPRVVMVASAAHRGARIDFDDPGFEGRYRARGWAAYAQSKLANILYARELARREPWLQVNSLHPGMVATGFAHNNGGLVSRLYRLVDLFAVTPAEGARTTIHLAGGTVGVSGRYFEKEREVTPSRAALDDGAALRLWELTERTLNDTLAGT